MSLFNIRLPDLVIPLGTAVSNVLNSNKCYDDAESIVLYAVNVTDGALTYTIEVNPDPNATNASPNWATLQVGDEQAVGSAVPPLATFARLFYELAAVMAFRIKASGNVTADRTWSADKAIFI